MKSSSTWLRYALFLLPASVACGGDRPHERELSLLPPESLDLNAEQERLRRMQMVKVINVTNPENPVEEEMTAAAVADLLFQYQCLVEGNESGPAIASLDYINKQICMAQRLLDMASDRATPVRLAEAGSNEVRLVPTQSAATSASLARQAMLEAPKAMLTAFCNLRLAVGLSPLPSEGQGSVNCSGTLPENTLKGRLNRDGTFDDHPAVVTPGSITLGAALADRAAEAYYVFREAAERAAKLNVAVGDAQRANPSVSLQVSRGLAGFALSRAAAAHVLIGGTPGLLGSTQDESRPGLCSVNELSAQGQKALSVLRDAGVSPEAVLASQNELSLDDLLNGGSIEAVPGGSVAQRLAERWGYNFDNPPNGIARRQSIADYFHLREEDFDAARRYLAQEIVAFSRSKDAQLEPPPTPGGTYKRFAGTAQPPMALPTEYYAALAAFNESQPSGFAVKFSPEVTFGGMPAIKLVNLAQGIDAALTHAGLVLERQANIVDASLRADIMTPLATMLSARERIGRVEVCRTVFGADNEVLDLNVGGFSETDGLAVVRGEDGLRCAVEGTIEGAPCAASFDISPIEASLKLADLDSVGSPPDGFSEAASGSFSMDERLSGTRIYLVQRTASGTTPGSYKPLVGIHLEPANENLCFQLPIVPDAAAQAARILSPSPQWCTGPRVSCGDREYDARLPLEDELSGDADGVESSWKHYLALAKLAATHADQLGNEYLQQGVEYESRLETVELSDEQKEQLAQDKALAAVVELQDTCGTAIDPVRLLKLLSTPSEPGVLFRDGSDLKLVRDDNQTPPCGEGYQEILGQCVVDFERLKFLYRNDPIYSDLVRLSACLSDDSVKSFVHLGSKERPVCLWHEINDPRTVCKDSDAAHPCPILSYQGKCDNLELPEGGPARQVVAVTEALKFFESNELPTFNKDALNVELNICDRIRAMRGSAAASDLFDSVRQSNRFAPLKVKEKAQEIGFEARYGGYAAISLNGGVRYSTGTPWIGPQVSSWPCAAAEVRGCGDAGEGPGLFCQQFDCLNELERSKANDRLARATIAIAASVTSISTFSGNPTTPAPALQKFVWPAFLPSGYSDNDDNFHELVRDGLTARDFFVNTTTSVPLSEYTSVTYKDLPNTGMKSYLPTSVEAGTIGYAYWARPTDAGPSYYLNTPATTAVLGQHFGFRNQLPVSFSVQQLRLQSDFGAVVADRAAKYFYNGLSNDEIERNGSGGTYAPGYYHQALQHKRGLGPLENAPAVGPGSVTFNYEEEAMLDGLELLCQLGEEGTDCGVPPPVSSVADLPATKKFLECIADQIKFAGAHTVLSEFPVQALDPLRREGTTGENGTVGGGLGVDVNLLRGALTELADVPVLISDQLKQLAVAINDVYLAVQGANLTIELADVQLQSQISNQIAGCFSSASSNIGTKGIGWNPGSIATCANSVAQIYFANEINSLVRQEAKLGAEFKLNDFNGTFSTIASTMSTYASRLSGALNDIDAQLAKVEQQQSRAKLALAKALYVRSFTSQFEARINAAQNARFLTARERYRRAQDTAQRMAFLAKRSIEMRLGIRLAEMTDDLPLVDAPAEWESTVCTLTGIDYEKAATGEVESFADEYIGDYVEKLQNVVESYRLVHNFHEGTDVAVMSLRDDIQNVRAVCEAPVHNELHNAGQLNVSSSLAPGWDRNGCASEQVEGLEVPLPNCIGVLEELGVNASPILGVPALSATSAYTLQFGDKASCDPATCGYRSGAYLGQELDVTPGLYRASVYVRDRTDYSDVGLRIALDGVVQTTLAQQTEAATLTAWPRVYVVFEVPAIQKLSFGFARPTLNAGSAPADTIVLAGPMLERLQLGTDELGVEPAAFVNTSDVRTRPLPVCEDTSGEVFRETGWTRATALLCEDGFSGTCDGSTAKPYGYWQTSFNINQRDIESGNILGKSGIARGNFNYRIESLGVNFVGTSVRNCADQDLPSTCYSAGYVPYTLIHNGPYNVRNHAGKDFQAQLFTGRIENARGLALERYITSPLASADRELLTDYTRFELQGRPLDGNFVLRVWDSPGVTFDGIQDVQIVLKYRYWTRFN